MSCKIVHEPIALDNFFVCAIMLGSLIKSPEVLNNLTTDHSKKGGKMGLFGAVKAFVNLPGEIAKKNEIEREKLGRTADWQCSACKGNVVHTAYECPNCGNSK